MQIRQIIFPGHLLFMEKAELVRAGKGRRMEYLRCSPPHSPSHVLTTQNSLLHGLPAQGGTENQQNMPGTPDCETQSQEWSEWHSDGSHAL